MRDTACARRPRDTKGCWFCSGQALLLGHPGKLVRDTARFPPLMLPRRPGGKARARSLRELAAEQLGLAIQVPALFTLIR